MFSHPPLYFRHCSGPAFDRPHLFLAAVTLHVIQLHFSRLRYFIQPSTLHGSYTSASIRQYSSDKTLPDNFGKPSAFLYLCKQNSPFSQKEPLKEYSSQKN